MPSSDEPLGRTRPQPRDWRLEDAVPGEVISHPGGRSIDATEHVWLAWLTHNVSDVHGNVDTAARSEWGEPLVLGMLTAAIVIGLAEPPAGPPPGAARRLGRGWERISLEGPVTAGATLSAESHIEAVGESDDGSETTVTRTIVGRDQTGTVVVRVQETRVLPRTSFRS